MANGHRIRELRASRQMSIAALAREAKVTRPTVYAAEAGRDVDLDTLVKIAAALSVPVGEISPEAGDLLRAAV